MKKILIVEDDYDIGEIVEMTLSTEYQVLVKRDSERLTEVLKQYVPDVILMDNHVGRKDAKEMIEEINSGGFNLTVPIVLFSAHNDIEAIAAQIGATGYLEKPFNLDDLHQCVSSILLSAEQQQYSNR